MSTPITIIENSEGHLAYAKEGVPYLLSVTPDMCSLSLGQDVECSDSFVCMGSSPYSSSYTGWHYPQPEELTDDEARIIASEHHEHANVLGDAELAHYGQHNPNYLLFLPTYKK